jgi:AbrB family looped-hinge helix DNA binding protein
VSWLDTMTINPYCDLMAFMTIAKITRGGQVSLPATIRRRWGTKRVAVDDRGDHIVLRPVPDDPIAAARGSLKGLVSVPTARLREIAREDEATAERHKRRRTGR